MEVDSIHVLLGQVRKRERGIPKSIHQVFKCRLYMYIYKHMVALHYLFSSTIGLCIEFWKITKAVHVKVDSTHKILGLVPRVRFVDRKTYKESRTKEYDDVCGDPFSFLL